MRTMDIVYGGNELARSIDITQVYTVFRNEMSNNYSSYGETHDFWEYIYIHDGNLLVDIENAFLELEKGDFFLHKPNKYHRHFVLDAHASIYITSFECSNELLYQIAHKKIKLNSLSKGLILESINFADKVFNEISEDIIDGKESFIFLKDPKRNILYEQMLKNTLENILLLILVKEKETNTIEAFVKLSEVNRTNGISDIIIGYMSEHIYENISVEQICKFVHLGKTAVSTKFKQETGKSIIAYFNSLKIEKAIELLHRTNMNISEISLALNFITSQYFSKVFKKYTGTLPSIYKENINNSKLKKIVSK